jgi:hypothetical protein
MLGTRHQWVLLPYRPGEDRRQSVTQRTGFCFAYSRHTDSDESGIGIGILDSTIVGRRKCPRHVVVKVICNLLHDQNTWILLILIPRYLWLLLL